MHTAEKEIIQELLKKTQANQVEWEKTSVSDQLQLQTQNAVVILDANDPDDPDFQFRIFSLDRKRVVSNLKIDSSDGDEDYILLRTLYIAAHDNFFATEQTLNGLLAELKSS